MIVRKILIWLMLIMILYIVQSDGERWSRKTSNSEWIPLVNPQNNKKRQSQVQMSSILIADKNIHPVEQVSILSLSPTLQQQYQSQLQQLQKTKESIQKLLLLQQQLKAQQQLLQSQAYQPNSFTNTHDEKQVLHQSTIRNLQTLPILTPEILISTVPSSKVLPPLFLPQDFHSSGLNPKLNKEHQNQHLITNSPFNSEQNNPQTDDQLISQNRHKNGEKNYDAKQKNHYDIIQRSRKQPFHMNFVAPMINSVQDSNNNPQEIQLVYVPAEILAQREQVKLHKSQSRKHHPAKYYQNHLETFSTSAPIYNAYDQQILSQLQHIEGKNQFLHAEREKNITKLYTEQKELEKQARVHKEVVSTEVFKLKEAENKRKELNTIEVPNQRELYKLQEIKEKQRQGDGNLAGLKTKEKDIQKKFEQLFDYEKIQEVPPKQEYEQNDEHKTRTKSVTVKIETFDNDGIQFYEIKQPESQSQLYHQHLTEVTNKVMKGFKLPVKAKNKLSDSHSQQFDELTEMQLTTPLNQPPLSIYMSTNISSHYNYQLIDVLKILKNSKSIDVLDGIGTDNPSLFVGPRYLDPPVGYVKFDLTYLSSIDNSRIENKFDKLPFFVAPLSFDPPFGYSKIPFPAPHIGSIIINNVENIEAKLEEAENLNTKYLIESNSYFLNNKSILTHDTNTSASYLQKSSTVKYDTSFLPTTRSNTKLKFMEFHENIPSTKILPVTKGGYNEEQMPNDKFELPFKNKNYYNLNEVFTTPIYHIPKVTLSPVYQEKSIINHNIKPHIINLNIESNEQELKNDHKSKQYQHKNEKYTVDSKRYTVDNMHPLNSSPNYDQDTQYNLSAHLPAISSQLPRLVNALVEKSEVLSTFPSSTTTIIMTTNTTEVSTTYRSNSWHRSKPATLRTISTTISPVLRSNSHRGRKPLTRSRLRYTTTTEQNLKLSYDRIKPNPIVTSRYNEKDSYTDKKIIDAQKYNVGENKIRESTQTQQMLNLNHRNEQVQYSNHYKKLDLPALDLRNVSSLIDDNVQASLNISSYKSNNYATSTIVPITSISNDNLGIFNSTSLHDYEGPQNSTHIQNYQTSIVYEQVKAEERPINGFHYKSQEDSFNSQHAKKSSYYKPEKMENIKLKLIVTTESPNVQKMKLQDYSPVYHSISVHDQYKENGTSKPIYYNSINNNNSNNNNNNNNNNNINNNNKNNSHNDHNNNEEVSLISQINQKEFAYQTTTIKVVSEVVGTIINITATTTEVPSTIRQHGRSRLNNYTEIYKDSVIQTQSNGSHDEYVQFRAINQNPVKPSSRQQIRSRIRVQQIQHKNSPIQTDGQEYVRIQTTVPQHRKTDNSAIIKSTMLAERISVSADGTLVNESDQSQTQILKNRQDMYFATRRPMITARVPNPHYTDGQYVNHTQSNQFRVGEMKVSKSRSRLRRPGIKRRATTTTIGPIHEQSLKTVSHGLHPMDAVVNMQRNFYNYRNPVIYDKNLTSVKITPKYGEDLINENYPQKFISNYGTEQNHRDRYDQRQINSNLPHQYYSMPVTSTGRLVHDIYGAESQWSTKLIGNSFQPSSYYLSQEINKLNKSIDLEGKNDTNNLQDIITISYDEPSITVFVTSNSNNIKQNQESLSNFNASVMDSNGTKNDSGKKMNTGNQINNAIITPVTIPSNKNTIELNNNKNISTTFKKGTLRRRRVRVRVKSARSRLEDFSTDKFQNYHSTFNDISQKMTDFRNLSIITEPTIAAKTIVHPTTSTVESRGTDKSILETSFDKVLDKKNLKSIIELNTVVTMPTEISNSSWTVSTIMIPEALVQDSNNSIMNYLHSSTYLINSNNIDKDINNKKLPIATEKIIESTNVFTTSINEMTVYSTTQKSEETKNNSEENVIQQRNLDNLYKYFVTKSPIFNDYLENQENSKNSKFYNDNINYAKNHRSKWSGVHLSDKILFDFAKENDKSPNQREEEEYINKKKNTNEKSYNASITDYVKAIFESNKTSDDEDQDQSAKLQNQSIIKLNQDNTLFKIEKNSNLPKEIKTSFISSIVCEPEVSFSLEQDNITITPTSKSIRSSPFVSSTSDRTTELLKKNNFESNFRKILRTSTTTKISHMTEICYRGHCVMSKPKKED